MISLWTFSGLVGGEVGGSLHHQLSGFNLSGGVSVPVGSIQLTSPGGDSVFQIVQRYFWVYALVREPGPFPRAALLLLGCSSLVSASLSFPLISNRTCPLWNLRKVMEAE